MTAVRGRWTQIQELFRQEQVAVIMKRVMLGLLAVLFLVVGTLLVAFDSLGATNPALTLSAGQVAPEDIRAPVSISYESAVLTNQRREVAENTVRDVYDPPDPSIARQQLQLARQVLDYIGDVRADEYATVDELKSDIQAVGILSLSDDEIDALLNTPLDVWQEIDEQIITVLERVMRNEIRDDTLRNIKANIPNLVSVRFAEDEVVLITAIVEDLIQTNTFFNEDRTQEARQAASDAVPSEIRNFEQGQLVIRGGSVVTDADMEALTQLGLLQQEDRRAQELLSALLLNALVVLLLGVYTSRFYPDVFGDASQMILLGGIFVIILAGARMAGPQRVVQPFLYTTSALGLLFATLVGPQMGIIATIALAILVGEMAGGFYVLAVMTLIGGIVGVLALRDTEHLNSYFVAGVLSGLANVAVIFAFYLTGFPADSLGALTLMGAGLINGVLSGVIALAGLYLISNVFNVPTSLRLIELMQPNQQLLQRLLREAPGTYQHSLQVANLAELAAERVGANVNLTRVGALYHDVGKTAAPHFFIENQVDGVNPHDGLNDPYRSARIIIDHVIEGEKMGRRYRLPDRVRDFILEHHGTTLPMYFYRKAIEEAGDDESAVDRALFTYPGPRPQSPETAILMLADGCESTVRARRPRNKQEIADTVTYIFETRQREGQLDESGLTLNDLSVIQKVFVETLQGVFHPRIAYTSKSPGAGAQEAPEAAENGVEAALSDSQDGDAPSDEAALQPPVVEETDPRTEYER